MYYVYVVSSELLTFTSDLISFQSIANEVCSVLKAMYCLFLDGVCNARLIVCVLHECLPFRVLLSVSCLPPRNSYSCTVSSIDKPQLPWPT